MKDVNFTIGRFQPFTKGHLQMCQDGYDKNGLPAVVLMISNKNQDSRHPFSDHTIKKEIDLIKKRSSAVEDVLLVNSADIVKAGQELNKAGYVPHLWLCGDDRAEPYRRQISNKKYIEQGMFPSDVDVFTGTGRVEGVSGTAVRNAISSGDADRFKELMPKGTERLFGDFADEMSNVSEEETQSLDDFLLEIL